MTTHGSRVALARNSEFCLRLLSEGDLCSKGVSDAAAARGLNRTNCRNEWADAPLRRLHAAGLACHSGAKSDFGRKEHQITPPGRAWLRNTKGDEQ